MDKKRLAKAKRNALLIARTEAAGLDLGSLPLSDLDRMEAMFVSPEALIEARLGPAPFRKPRGTTPQVKAAIEQAKADFIGVHGRDPTDQEWSVEMTRVRGLDESQAESQLRTLQRARKWATNTRRT